MEFTDAQIAEMLQQYVLPFFRISALFMVMPIIGTKIVSSRVRLLAAFFITLLAVPMLPKMPVLPLLSLQLAVAIAQEILIGIAIGFLFQLVFQVFVLAGQFIALKLGMGFASMNDPASGVSVTSLSQFYLMIVTLMFIGVNGHLILVELVVNSFQTLVPGATVFSAEKLWQMANLGGWLFAAALVMSLPVFASSMLVNIAFGVMSRSAPQLNIFAVGFPFTLLCGLLMIWLGLTTFVTDFEQVSATGFGFVHEFLETR